MPGTTWNAADLADHALIIHVATHSLSNTDLVQLFYNYKGEQSCF